MRELDFIINGYLAILAVKNMETVVAKILHFYLTIGQVTYLNYTSYGQFLNSYLICFIIERGIALVVINTNYRPTVEAQITGNNI